MASELVKLPTLQSFSVMVPDVCGLSRSISLDDFYEILNFAREPLNLFRFKGNMEIFYTYSWDDRKKPQRLGAKHALLR